MCMNGLTESENKPIQLGTTRHGGDLCNKIHNLKSVNYIVIGSWVKLLPVSFC